MRSDDEYEDDAVMTRRASRRRQRSAPSGLAQAASIVAVLAWMILIPAAGMIGFMLFHGLSEATSAIQEAAISALCATLLIGLYVVVRAVDKLAYLATNKFFCPKE